MINTHTKNCNNIQASFLPTHTHHPRSCSPSLLNSSSFVSNYVKQALEVYVAAAKIARYSREKSQCAQKGQSYYLKLSQAAP